MAIEVIAFGAGILGLLLLVVASLAGPRERPPPSDGRGVFIPGLHHFDDDDDNGAGPHHS